MLDQGGSWTLLSVTGCTILVTVLDSNSGPISHESGNGPVTSQTPPCERLVRMIPQVARYATRVKGAWPAPL